MNLNTWMRISWNNEYLKWNTSDFDGLKSITVEKEKVWVPDITLWNRLVFLLSLTISLLPFLPSFFLYFLLSLLLSFVPFFFS